MTTPRYARLAALAAVGLAALLAGCTINIYQDGRYQGGGKASASNPMVVVVGGKIQRVVPDPLVFAPDQVNVTVTWRLPKDGTLTFPAKGGIVFEAKASDEIVNCRASEDRKEFSCLNRHSKPGIYKYVVQVDDNGKPLDPLDPHLVDL